jgi:hypothetical protein
MSREEGNKLLNALLPFAQRMLAKHGEFHPFGAFLNQKSEVTLLAGYNGDEHPAPKDLIEMMYKTLSKEANQKGYLAVGICYDVLVTPPKEAKKTDAIQVAIEHSDGEAVNVYIPYRKNWLGKIGYGEIFASAAVPRVFKKSD